MCALWLLAWAGPAGAGEPPASADEPRWGVAAGLRYADIPLAAPDQSESDIVPLLFYNGERVFLDGLEGGLLLARRGGWRLNAFARYRFIDFPEFARERVRSDSWDVGLQVRGALRGEWQARSELLTDGEGASYIDAGIETRIGDARAQLRPYAGVRIKSSAFNDRYFGLGMEALGGGVDLHARLGARVHLYRNLYLLSSVGGYYLDGDARRSAAIDDDFGWHAFAGLGVFEAPRGHRRALLQAGPYWRLAHGWATTSSIGDIVLRTDVETDPFDNRLTSLFYGHPVADDLFGWPLAIYLTPGVVFHHASSTQGQAGEYVIAFKAYYTAPWPVRVRLGVAEGFSYAAQVTDVERTALEAKGDRPSKLLNFLDISIDVNAGDLFARPSARRLWLGFSIHHRSGVFGTGSQFGHISGGSNYTTFYLQWHH